MGSPLEKSAAMEARYSSLGEDPWGNRERQLYQRILKRAVELSYNALPEDLKELKLYDIGAGGGNVIDTWLQNLPENYTLDIKGCELSGTAIKFLEDRYPDSFFDVIDLEEYDASYPLQYLKEADLVSIVDVMYYFDTKRDYKVTLDHIWETIKPGAVVLVADNLIRAFRRSYFSKKPDCELLHEYTDYTEPVCQETYSNGRAYKRYLKVKIYRKLP